jgi:hypothetical protein
MKKNMIKVAFVAAIAMVSGINVFNAQKSETLSEVALANVEALAVVDDNWYCVGEEDICLKDSQGVIEGRKFTIKPEN